MNATMVTRLLAANTNIALDKAAKELPQFSARIAEMQADMKNIPTPQAKLCEIIIKNLLAMYEGNFSE